VFTYPIFSALSHTTPSFLPAFFLVTALVLIHSGYSSVSAVVKAELFPTNVRALGVALPYAIANTVFGGTAEYVALWFKSQKLESGFYIYVAGIMAIAFLIAIRIRNTNVQSMIEED
jgi:MHS family alpha-ketoglutarate permease-like MFS transporter